MRKLLLLLTIMVVAGSAWSQNSITQGASKAYTIQMNVGNSAGAVYLWSVVPAGGTSTDLTAITGNTAAILWDGTPGVYAVSVQVTDGNGCLSEPIDQSMEVLVPGDLVFAAALPNTQTCSDLTGGGEGSVPAHSQSLFRVTYGGDANLVSVKITVKNPLGSFVDLNGAVLANQANPELTVTNDAADKAIDITLADTWENTSAANVQFELTLVSAQTSDNSEIIADTNADVTRTVTILPKPLIAFE